MNAHIEDALRASAADLTLDTPSAAVLRRGDDLRRRRRRGVLTGATGAAAVATLAVVTVLGNQSSGGGPRGPVSPVGPTGPDASSIQVASWSGPTTNVSDDLLVEAQRVCAVSADATVRRSRLTEPGWGLFDSTEPVAAEVRDGVVLTYFRQGRDYATCTLTVRDDGRAKVAAQGAGIDKAIPDGRELDVVTLGAGDPGPVGGPLTDIYAVLRTSSDVDRVEVEVGGDTYVSMATDGLALFWLDDDTLTEDDLSQASATAFDADGGALDGLAAGDLW